MTPLSYWVARRLSRFKNPDMSANMTYPDDDPYGENVQVLLMLAQNLYIYYVPVIICFGIATNTFMCVVLLKTKLRKKFFTHIFAAINICDAGFLATLLLIWIKDQGVDIYRAPGLCQVVIFMSHFFPFLSFWNSISASLILIVRAKSSCLTNTCQGTGKARTLVISLSIFTFTIYIYKTWTNGVLVINDTRFCTVLPETEGAMKVLNIMDVIFLLVIPFVMFLIFDLVTLVKKILKYFLVNSLNRSKVYRDALKVIIAHSVCFHLFVGPGCISKLIFIFRVISGSADTYQFKDLVLENIFQYFFYTYFGIKPVVHFCVSKSFRAHFRGLIFKAKETMSMSRMLLNSNSQEQTLLWSAITWEAMKSQ